MQSLQKFKSFRYTSGRFIGLVGIFICLLLTFSGCGSSADQKIHIQLSTWGSAQEITILRSLIREFEQAHPRIQVDILHIPDNYYQKLHILIAGDMTPDVMFTNNLSFPIYASQGVFMDLRPLLAKQTELKETDFYAPALDAFTWGGINEKGEAVLGALPRDISDVVVFYNKEQLKAAGLPEPKADWDWAAFVKTVQALTQDANQDGKPETFGISFYNKPPLFWLPFVWSAGGDLFSPDLKQVLLTQPASLEGLRFYADLRNRWHVAPTKVESGGATMSQLFLQKKLAMMVSGRWSVPVLREQAKFDWDVAPLPIGPSGKSRVGIDASGYAISAKTPHPQESFELIRFLLSRPAIEKATTSGLIVPARRDVAESPVFLEPSQAPRHGRVFLDAIADGVPTHTPPRWNEFSEELQLALEPVWDGQQDAGEAMKKAQPHLQHLLEVSP